MAEALRSGVWGWRGLFVATALAVLFVRLLPLGGEAGRWPGPDILLCLACAWVLRRPDYVPVLLVGAVVLLEDMLLMRPPGLWAALVVLGTEFLRSRSGFSRELTFMAEWMMVAVAMTAMTLAFRVGMAVVMLPQPALTLTLVQLAGSILAYPFVVGASRLAFGLRKPATGEVDALGRPL